MRRLILVLVSVSGLGLAPACGAGDPTSPVSQPTPATVTVTATPTGPSGRLSVPPLETARTTPRTTPRTTSRTTPRPTAGPKEPAGPTPLDLSRVDLPGFTTPSGNIGCLFDHYQGVHVRCDRLEMDAVPSGKPADCAFDWGHSVELYAGQPGAATCTSDSVLGLQGETDGSRVLAYGDAVRYRGILCSSAEHGLSCSTSGGHGFVLSRAAISVQ